MDNSINPPSSVSCNSNPYQFSQSWSSLYELSTKQLGFIQQEFKQAETWTNNQFDKLRKKYNLDPIERVPEIIKIVEEVKFVEPIEIDTKPVQQTITEPVKEEIVTVVEKVESIAIEIEKPVPVVVAETESEPVKPAPKKRGRKPKAKPVAKPAAKPKKTTKKGKNQVVIEEEEEQIQLPEAEEDVHNQGSDKHADELESASHKAQKVNERSSPSQVSKTMETKDNEVIEDDNVVPFISEAPEIESLPMDTVDVEEPTIHLEPMKNEAVKRKSVENNNNNSKKTQQSHSSKDIVSNIDPIAVEEEKSDNNAMEDDVSVFIKPQAHSKPSVAPVIIPALAVHKPVIPSSNSSVVLQPPSTTSPTETVTLDSASSSSSTSFSGSGSSSNRDSTVSNGSSVPRTTTSGSSDSARSSMTTNALSAKEWVKRLQEKNKQKLEQQQQVPQQSTVTSVATSSTVPVPKKVEETPTTTTNNSQSNPKTPAPLLTLSSILAEYEDEELPKVPTKTPTNNNFMNTTAVSQSTLNNSTIITTPATSNVNKELLGSPTQPSSIIKSPGFLSRVVQPISNLFWRSNNNNNNTNNTIPLTPASSSVAAVLHPAIHGTANTATNNNSSFNSHRSSQEEKKQSLKEQYAASAKQQQEKLQQIKSLTANIVNNETLGESKEPLVSVPVLVASTAVSASVPVAAASVPVVVSQQAAIIVKPAIPATAASNSSVSTVTAGSNSSSTSQPLSLEEKIAKIRAAKQQQEEIVKRQKLIELQKKQEEAEKRRKVELEEKRKKADLAKKPAVPTTITNATAPVKSNSNPAILQNSNNITEEKKTAQAVKPVVAGVAGVKVLVPSVSTTSFVHPSLLTNTPATTPTNALNNAITTEKQTETKSQQQQPQPAVESQKPVVVNAVSKTKPAVPSNSNPILTQSVLQSLNPVQNQAQNIANGNTNNHNPNSAVSPNKSFAPNSILKPSLFIAPVTNLVTPLMPHTPRTPITGKSPVQYHFSPAANINGHNVTIPPSSANANGSHSYTMSAGRAILVPGNENNYEMSEHENSSDEDEESDDEYEQQKKIPGWAKDPLLSQALHKQQSSKVDPDSIFGLLDPHSLNLGDIFKHFKKKKRMRDRTSSGNWQMDRLSIREEAAYKKQMGYA